MQLTDAIEKKMQEKEILLMTHLVLGYPSFEANRKIIAQMVDNGVDLIEMQIPFSEPVADGPVIAKANQISLSSGTRVWECLQFAEEMIATHSIPFLFMTYYNILFKFGVEEFVKEAAEIGIQGFIIPDLPPEEGKDFLAYAKQYKIAPILIYAPTSTDERMEKLAGYADGFIYCVARRGVTGAQTSFGPDFDPYIARCRNAAKMPIAVGFGIREKADIDYLKGKADIAVIGSATITLVDEKGVDAVGDFIAGLRG
jgi:tryptophan synthase alpha chain